MKIDAKFMKAVVSFDKDRLQMVGTFLGWQNGQFG